LNRPAGDVFPDLYLTDDAFSMDQNFFYRVLDHQKNNKNPAKEEDANLINFSIHTGYGKNNRWPLRKSSSIFPFDLFMGVATWIVYTTWEGKVNLKTR
jgi:cytoskeletal protein RodZ